MHAHGTGWSSAATKRQPGLARAWGAVVVFFTAVFLTATLFLAGVVLPCRRRLRPPSVVSKAATIAALPSTESFRFAFGLVLAVAREPHNATGLPKP